MQLVAAAVLAIVAVYLIPAVWYTAMIRWYMSASPPVTFTADEREARAAQVMFLRSEFPDSSDWGRAARVGFSWPRWRFYRTG